MGDRNGSLLSTKILAIVALSVSVASAVAAIVVYWESADTQVLGGLAALASLSAGIGLVLWVRGFMSEEEAEGEREPLEAKDPQWEELVSSVAQGRDLVGRRKVLIGFFAAFIAFITLALLSFMRSIVGTKRPSEVLFHTDWTKGARLTRLNGTFVKADSFPVDSIVVAFPEGHIGSLQSAVNLIHVKESLLDLPDEQKKWAVKGMVAYSRICTHAACPISQYEDTIHTLACPCHQSTFNVLKGAVPTGGPATRPLPQLPLGVDSEGYLIAQSDFTRPVGPGFWGISS